MRYIVIITTLILTLVLTHFLSSCGGNRFDIDTAKVSIEPVVLKRLDKDLFAMDQNNVKAETVKLKQRYGSLFYNRYISSIINNGGTQDSLYSESLLRFITDKDMSITYSDIIKTYSDNDVELVGDELSEAMKRFKVFFPKRNTPKQYVTFMSGFNYNIVYVDSTLAIGLEMYLGKDYKYYSALQLPKFRVRTMTKEHIVPDAVRGMLLTEFDNADPVNNLLNHMIFYGKIFYVCDALLPDRHDSVKFSYTARQVATCIQHEKNYWKFFVKDNTLYENDLKLINEFTADGPFTRAISHECPPRIAMWLGRQIVKSYMDHNKEVSFEDLMNEKDAQKILSRSKYKP